MLNSWVLIIVGVALVLPKIGLWTWAQRLTGWDRAGIMVWEIGLLSIIFGIILLIA